MIYLEIRRACKDSSSHDSVLICLFSTSCSHQHVDTTQKESCDKISHFGHDCRKYGMLYHCCDCGFALPIKPRCIWFSIEWLHGLNLNITVLTKDSHWPTELDTPLTSLLVSTSQSQPQEESHQEKCPPCFTRSAPLLHKTCRFALQDVPILSSSKSSHSSSVLRCK